MPTSPSEKRWGWPMWYLTLIFTCCGIPQSVNLPQNFATQQACDKAGQVWLQPNSNPDGTVKTFRCSARSDRTVTGNAYEPAAGRTGQPERGETPAFSRPAR
jgi:hypothetical protein